MYSKRVNCYPSSTVPRKDLPKYRQVFKKLHSNVKEQCFQLDSTSFVCDFEIALISAVRGSFCNTRVEYKVAFSTFAKLYFGRSAGLA
ncbi:hypothetical protein T10_10277 [Trichinella papuae]|uniref:Uncharacterized protein n=1 Tax=Trichinella papuae TaxID=268474 RepID=A0A0V1M9R8_9BILA|nr:hypothetical protein T10_10277 [Trichinella papuae]